MAKSRVLDYEDIRSHVGQESFTRGERYVRDGFISNVRKSGNLVKGTSGGSTSGGSSGGPYRVQATVENGRITASDCSCPIGGACKHVAALLIVWVSDFSDAPETPDPRAQLRERSKAQLLELIEMMLDQQPELEDLLEITLATAAVAEQGDASSDEPVDAKSYRRQAATAFGGHGNDWGYQGNIAKQLRTLLKQAGKLEQQKKLAQAVALYQGVVEAVLEHEDEAMSDEAGELYDVVGDCANGLGAALEETHHPKLRGRILEVLLDIYLGDIKMGGSGFGDDAPDLIATHANTEEKQVVIQKLRAQLGDTGNTWTTQWRAQTIGSFILDLEGDDLDDEAYLRTCRQTGRWVDLVNRLLSLKRVDEAVAEARQTEDYTLLALADVFVTYKQAEIAEQLIVERAAKSKDTRFAQWLRERSAAKKDWPAALEWSKKLFDRYASLSEYKEIQRFAEKLKRWDEERTRIIAALEKSRNFEFLIQCYLDEKQIEAAIDALKRKGASHPTGYAYFGDALAIQVAKAAEAKYPGEALDIYRAHAEAVIASRSRSYYAQACEYLLRAQVLSKRLKQDAAWQVFLINLVASNKQLRALREEMTKVGLI